ncbi:uncharacterized protein AB9X84_015103 [Acanthopagrus schlegelii]
MSWQGYIDNLMLNKEIAAAAICGTEGGVWAATDMFTGITSDQIKAVCGEPGNGSTVTLAGVKAMVITNEASNDIKLMTLVTMKNTVINESSPLVIGFSTKALVIGLSKPGYRSVGISVEKMTTYLKGVGM